VKKLLKYIAWSAAVLFLLLLLFLAWLKWGLAPVPPEVKDLSALELTRKTSGPDHYTIGSNWLRKNKDGLWEEYVEGAAFERGVILGKLNREMLYSQEQAFVDQIHKLVPENYYLTFLALLTRFFNRELEANIPVENKLEIYGESFSVPHEFDFIGPAYDRMLNYHAAHDIGHALQSLAVVGCTSFAGWNSFSSDSGLIIGRNFDFSLGDQFGNDKIILFCHPDKGHNFAMVTWAGFIGCASGMNDAGITVTINAAKSDVPTKAATPIALVARQILQYAGNINEANAIAKKYKTFVCESIMIGSASDHKAVIIEKSIAKTILFESSNDLLLCTNHYQSDSFKADLNNIENMETSASVYRFHRLEELLGRHPEMTPSIVAEILRDQKGLKDSNIGMGNEKAINQLLSHHAVIFQPEKLRMWVSVNPYQINKFICYDLREIFSNTYKQSNLASVADTMKNIPADTFLQSNSWVQYQLFKSMKATLRSSISRKSRIKDENTFVKRFIASNPDFWETYYWLAEYFRVTGNKESAKIYYRAALKREINTVQERKQAEQKLAEII
jgi:isopenicillin-N N-acyltransferase-like protein